MNTRIIPMQFSQPDNGLGKFTRPPARFARFGSFDLDFHRQELLRSGTRVALPRKVLEVLMILIEKPGEVVTRELLRARLWPPDQNVNFDSNVNTTVNRLRQALGDSTSKPAFVETLPRRGYVFIAKTEYSDEPSTAASHNLMAATPQLSDHLQLSIAKADERSPWLSLRVLGFLIAGIIIGALASYIALHR